MYKRQLDLKTNEADIKEVTQYFDNLLTCMNSGTEDVPDHPANVPYFKVTDFESDYKGIVNYYRRHRCREGYCCKRVNKVLQLCRFNFPFDPCEETRIDVITDKDGRESLKLVLKRNDPYVNSHHKGLASVSRSNTDVQAVLDALKVVAYCANYVCKPEPKSLF